MRYSSAYAQSRLSSAISIVIFSLHAVAENHAGTVRKAVKRSTLNQPGTKPFHLKATVNATFVATKTAVASQKWKFGGYLRTSGDVRFDQQIFTKSKFLAITAIGGFGRGWILLPLWLVAAMS